MVCISLNKNMFWIYFKMLGCKPASTPLDSSCTSENKLGIALAEVDIHSYQNLVGKLIYLSHTRPDIC